MNTKSSGWNFFTNHGHVLFLISKNEEASVRDIAIDVGITERAVRRIIADLASESYISISKIGRSNKYKINKSKKLKHKVEGTCTIKDLLKIMNL